MSMQSGIDCWCTVVKHGLNGITIYPPPFSHLKKLSFLTELTESTELTVLTVLTVFSRGLTVCAQTFLFVLKFLTALKSLYLRPHFQQFYLRSNHICAQVRLKDTPASSGDLRFQGLYFSADICADELKHCINCNAFQWSAAMQGA